MWGYISGYAKKAEENMDFAVQTRSVELSTVDFLKTHSPKCRRVLQRFPFFESFREKFCKLCAFETRKKDLITSLTTLTKKKKYEK